MNASHTVGIRDDNPHPAVLVADPEAWSRAQAFSTQQIEQQLPPDTMRRGDCSGLPDVEATVADFYRSRGFPNNKVHSLVQPNKATEQFDLTLYIAEAR